MSDLRVQVKWFWSESKGSGLVQFRHKTYRICRSLTTVHDRFHSRCECDGGVGVNDTDTTWS